jgi:amino-acid N-acetyltransferase
MHARKAFLPDASAIEKLIRVHTTDGTLLPRPLADICENIRDFIVIEEEGRIVGCGALHLYGMHLAEIRSITVSDEARRKGAGRMLVNALIEEGRNQRVKGICLFTRIPEFFARLGFRQVDRAALPDKIYKDCLLCPRLHACDEVPMLRGEVPSFAILGPARHAINAFLGAIREQ